MESLTQEQDNIVQMGTIKTWKDQSLDVGVSNASNEKKKSKDSKQPEEKKLDRPKNPDGGLNPCKYKDNKGSDKYKCTYCHKGWNLESSYMNKTIDMITHLLERNNIPVPNSARKKDGSLAFDNKEKRHALVAGSSHPSTFIIDLVPSSHMTYAMDFFILSIQTKIPAASKPVPCMVTLEKWIHMISLLLPVRSRIR